MKAFFTYAIVFAFGAVALSNLSSTINFRALHLPVYLPELIALPFLACLFPTISRYFYPAFRAHNFSHKLVLVCIGIVLFSLYSVFFNKLGLYSVASTARGYLYLIICMIVFSRVHAVNSRIVYVIALGMAAGTLLDGHLEGSLGQEESIRNQPNLPALFLLVAIPLAYRKYPLFVFSLIVAVALCLDSALRRSAAVVAVAIGATLFVVILKRSGNPARKVILSALVFSATLGTTFATPFLADWFGASEYQRRRVIGRTTEVFETRELGSSGRHRTDQAISTFKEIPTLLFPRGFIAKQTSITGKGRFTDFPLYELLYTFGAIVSGPLLIFWSCKAFKKLQNERRQSTVSFETVCAASVFLFALLLVSSGTFLFFTYEVPFTGLLLGRILYIRSRNRSVFI